jgi:hypothetical protein
VAADATSTGRSRPARERLEERLDAGEAVLERHPDWRTGELLHALARAWRLTGDHSRAVRFYREALVASDGMAPLQAAEQLGNMLDRLDRDGIEPPPVDLERQALLERAAAEGGKHPALAWLDWVDAVARTHERASLRGGFLKRAATRAADGAARDSLLAEAAESYALAVEIRRRAAGTVDYYSGLNAAALAWASGAAQKGARAARKIVRELVEPSRKSARAERAQGRNFWNAIADCEADLVEALLLGRLDERRAKELHDRYKRVLDKGAPTQQASARGQLAFLLSCAVGPRAGLRTGLETILTAFEE